MRRVVHRYRVSFVPVRTTTRCILYGSHICCSRWLIRYSHLLYAPLPTITVGGRSLRCALPSLTYYLCRCSYPHYSLFCSFLHFYNSMRLRDLTWVLLRNSPFIIHPFPSYPTPPIALYNIPAQFTCTTHSTYHAHPIRFNHSGSTSCPLPATTITHLPPFVNDGMQFNCYDVMCVLPPALATCAHTHIPLCPTHTYTHMPPHHTHPTHHTTPHTTPCPICSHLYICPFAFYLALHTCVAFLPSFLFPLFIYPLFLPFLFAPLPPFWFGPGSYLIALPFLFAFALVLVCPLHGPLYISLPLPLPCGHTHHATRSSRTFHCCLPHT